MFLSKRNGIWYLWFEDRAGRKQKVSTRTSSKTEAWQFLRSFNEQQAEIRKQRTTINAFSKDLFDHVKSCLSIGTHNIYLTAFRNLVRFVDDIYLDKLTPFHWDKYKIERLKNVSPVTVNIELRCLRAGINTAVRWRKILVNPFAGLPLLRIPQRQPVYFGRKDFVAVLQSIREEWLRNIVLLAGVTGMRQGELLSLRWEHIDFEHRLVHIESSVNFRTKAGKRRTIPLNTSAFELLLDLHSRNDSEFVFSLHGKPLLRRWVGEKLRRYIRTMGLNRKLNFHSLRHSFASWLAAEGVSIYQISKLLGHSSVSVTQDFYAHLQPDQLQEVVEMVALPQSRRDSENHSATLPNTQ